MPIDKYGPDIITTLAKRLRPFFLAQVGDNVGDMVWNRWHWVPGNGGKVQSFPPTDAGLTSVIAAAVADAVSGFIWAPPGSFGSTLSDITVPASVGMVAMGEKT